MYMYSNIIVEKNLLYICSTIILKNNQQKFFMRENYIFCFVNNQFQYSIF